MFLVCLVLFRIKCVSSFFFRLFESEYLIPARFVPFFYMVVSANAFISLCKQTQKVGSGGNPNSKLCCYFNLLGRCKKPSECKFNHRAAVGPEVEDFAQFKARNGF